MDWVGGVLIVVVLVIIGPASLFFGGAVWAAIIGLFGTDDAEARYADSEYVEHRAW